MWARAVRTHEGEEEEEEEEGLGAGWGWGWGVQVQTSLRKSGTGVVCVWVWRQSPTRGSHSGGPGFCSSSALFFCLARLSGLRV